MVLKIYTYLFSSQCLSYYLLSSSFFSSFAVSGVAPGDFGGALIPSPLLALVGTFRTGAMPQKVFFLKKRLDVMFNGKGKRRGGCLQVWCWSI